MPVFLTLSAACARTGIPEKDRFTLTDVARLLELPAGTIRRLARTGRLPAVRYTPKAAFVFAGDLEAFMRASYTARTVEVAA